jgi:hypothetical protein
VNRRVCYSAWGQSRPEESEQGDKWSFCLTAGKMSANQERL